MVVYKFFRIVLLFVLFITNSLKAQEFEEELPYANHTITNEILLKELQDYIKYNEWRYKKEEKAIGLFVTVNKDTISYKISYEFGYYYMISNYFPNIKFFNHPHLISKYKGYYVFFRFDGLSDIVLNEGIVDKIIKERYPEVYKQFEDGQTVLQNNYDFVPTVVIRVKNNILISKESYEE